MVPAQPMKVSPILPCQRNFIRRENEATDLQPVPIPPTLVIPLTTRAKHQSRPQDGLMTTSEMTHYSNYYQVQKCNLVYIILIYLHFFFKLLLLFLFFSLSFIILTIKAMNMNKLTCIHCKQCLSSRRVLRHHLETVHGDKRFPCRYCGKTYSRSDNHLQHESSNDMSTDSTTASSTFMSLSLSTDLDQLEVTVASLNKAPSVPRVTSSPCFFSEDKIFITPSFKSEVDALWDEAFNKRSTSVEESVSTSTTGTKTADTSSVNSPTSFKTSSILQRAPSLLEKAVDTCNQLA